MDDRVFSLRLGEIREDHRHGATELARRALEVLADSARGIKSGSSAEAVGFLQQRAEQLQRVRPSMAPIANLVSAWSGRLAEQQDQPLEYASKAWAASAEWLIENSREAVARTAANAAALVKDGATVMTHSLSSTLVSVFRGLEKRENLRVIVTESRPLNEGYWLAKVLSELGIESILITDAQMGLEVQHADLVLIGADGLLPDGSVVNKVGTYLLCLAAREHSVPVYVCCESFKQLSVDMESVELEEMDPRELGAPRYRHCQVKNTYFDVTPPQLIGAWINENGVQHMLPVEEPESGQTPSAT